MSNESKAEETWQIGADRFPTADGDYVYLEVPILKNGFVWGKQSVLGWDTWGNECFVAEGLPALALPTPEHLTQDGSR